MNAKKFISSALAGSMCSWAMLANAQQVPPEPVAETDSRSDAALEEIIVTAQKRAVSLEKVPATVNVVSAESLDNLQVKSFDALNALVPGYSFERTAGGNSFITMRGVGTTSAGQSLEQSVAAYINGVYAGGNGREFSTPFYDIDRIEVLKGTQSGIAGQNTSVGSINIVTRKPGKDFGGYFQAGHEFNFEGWNAEGAVDVPVSEDFQVRATGFYNEDGGWLKNVVTGNEPGEGRVYSGRLNAVWQTTEDVTVSLYGQYDDGRRLGSTFVSFGRPSPVLTAFIPDLRPEDTRNAARSSRSRKGGDESYEFTNLRGSLTVDVDLGGPTLTSITAASRIEDTLSVDSDRTPRDLQWLEQDAEYTQIHQEVRIVSPSDQRLTYIVGAWYRNAEQDKLLTTYLDPLFRADIPFLQKTETYSIFGDLQYALTDKFSIGGTARYTWETKRARAQSISNYATAFTAFPLSTGELTPDFLDGSVRVQYEPIDNLMLYALYAHGTKTGSFIDLSNRFQFLNPEEADTYEAGAKLRLPSRDLAVSLSAFQMDITGYQDVYTLVQNGVFSFRAENRDRDVQGVEFQGDWQPASGLTLGVTGTVMNSSDESGGEAVRTPRWSINGNFMYELPLATEFTVSFFGNVTYRSKYFSKPLTLGAAARESTATPAYTLLDLGADLKFDNGYWARLLVKNVTDTYAHLAADNLAGDPFSRIANQLPLRQVYLTLGYNF